MYEEYYEKLPDRNAYLSRIGIDDHNLAPTVETLDRLIMAQLTHVPFENLDVYDREMTPSLAIPDLFDKIVTRRRGGYCFELNALFMSLLEAVGFEVHAAASRVLWRRNIFSPYSHRVTIVKIDGRRYFCDVGFGGPAPTAALLIDSDEKQSVGDERFVVKTGAEDAKTFFRVTDGTPDPILYFVAKPFDPIDFIPLNFYISKLETSLFSRKRVANLKTEGGNAAIDGDILRVRVGDETAEMKLDSLDATRRALLEHFGISFDADMKPVAGE